MAAGMPTSAFGPQAEAGNGQTMASAQNTWRRPRRRVRFGSVLAAVFAGLLFLVVAGIIAVTAGSGASLAGGVGNDNNVPSGVAAVQRHYNLGLGRLEVDLSHVRFPGSGKTVDAKVGMGYLVIVLPPHTSVKIDARVGIGNIQLPNGWQGRSTRQTISEGVQGSRHSNLSVNAHVGAGVIDVRWGNSSS